MEAPAHGRKYGECKEDNTHDCYYLVMTNAMGNRETRGSRVGKVWLAGYATVVQLIELILKGRPNADNVVYRGWIRREDRHRVRR